ncbi:MAG: hypothetical protein Q9163_000011 [Psora crenata]
MAAAVRNSATDFVLFQQDYACSRFPIQDLDDTFMNMAGMHPQDHLLGQATASYDSYDEFPPRSLGPFHYSQTPQLTFDSAREHVGRTAQHPTQSASPSSFSQPYDHPPSIMSSASGASGQSTSSSADCSPRTHTTRQLHYLDKWSEPLHGLALAPGIVKHDASGQESYAAHEIGHDMGLEENKTQYCVGEYRSHSSTDSGLASPRDLVPFFNSSSQELGPYFSSSSVSVDPSIRRKAVTIDSILEEITRKTVGPTQLPSPASATWSSPTPPYLGTPSISPSGWKASTSAGPTPTPATSSFSPKPAPPIACAERESSMQPSCGRSMTPVSFGQTPFYISQDPFFGQSSGRIVAPLESSCSFSSKRAPV